MRAAIVNHRTTKRNIEECIEAIAEEVISHEKWVRSEMMPLLSALYFLHLELEVLHYHSQVVAREVVFEFEYAVGGWLHFSMFASCFTMFHLL